MGLIGLKRGLKGNKITKPNYSRLLRCGYTFYSEYPQTNQKEGLDRGE
jgi:hypothetical protein